MSIPTECRKCGVFIPTPMGIKPAAFTVALCGECAMQLSPWIADLPNSPSCLDCVFVQIEQKAEAA